MKVIIAGVETLEIDWLDVRVALVDDGRDAVTVEVHDYAGLGSVDDSGDEYENLVVPAPHDPVLAPAVRGTVLACPVCASALTVVEKTTNYDEIYVNDDVEIDADGIVRVTAFANKNMSVEGGSNFLECSECGYHYDKIEVSW